jgi:uncharacterized protein
MDNESQQIPRPLPVPTKVSKPYWDGCREGQLRIQRCSACGTHLFYPVYMCHECTSQKLDWVNASGHGTVHSYTVIYRAPYAQLGESGPYTVALIQLEEGPIMMSNIVDVAPETVRVGDKVRVEFQRASDEISLPVFRLVG